jgi:SAM-dependent methyltransferase
MGERETYLQRENPAFDAVLVRRTAAQEAAFFLPHLRRGMRLLDCGCGPGSITVGLAEVVAPGRVVGLDLETRQVQAGRALAADRGLTTVQFETGDVYALPFPDGSFDAVFAHMVLFHLNDPLRALREMRRVLAPGGVVGIRDADEGATLMAPTLPLIDELQALQMRLLDHHGASPFYARHQRRLLLEAGFARSEGQVSVFGGGTPELTRRHAAIVQARLRGPAAAELAIEQGWVTRERLEAMLDAMRAWGERPDAFYAMTICSAVGWVDD